MTLFLVKLDPTTMDQNRNPKFLAIVGRIIEVADKGYRFLPSTSAHKGSRKVWPNANACIPAWTANCGFLRLYCRQELDAAMSGMKSRLSG